MSVEIATPVYMDAASERVYEQFIGLLSPRSSLCLSHDLIEMGMILAARHRAGEFDRRIALYNSLFERMITPRLAKEYGEQRWVSKFALFNREYRVRSDEENPGSGEALISITRGRLMKAFFQGKRRVWPIRPQFSDYDDSLNLDAELYEGRFLEPAFYPRTTGVMVAIVPPDGYLQLGGEATSLVGREGERLLAIFHRGNTHYFDANGDFIPTPKGKGSKERYRRQSRILQVKERFFEEPDPVGGLDHLVDRWSADPRDFDTEGRRLLLRGRSEGPTTESGQLSFAHYVNGEFLPRIPAH